MTLGIIDSTTFEYTLPSSHNIEIGGRGLPDFHPIAKFLKWDGEVSAELSFPTGLTGPIMVDVPNRTITWETSEHIFKFFELDPITFQSGVMGNGKPRMITQNQEGGFEYEITLKSRPANDYVEFDFALDHLIAYPQPPLTPEEQLTDHRPENVIDSIAFYYPEKSAVLKRKEDGDRYKTGKAFHLYRPKAIDDDGDEIWCVPQIETSGKLRVYIDGAWLDNATYPVKLDPVLGYNADGGSRHEPADDSYRGSVFTTTEAGTVDDGYIYGEAWDATWYFKAGLVLHSSLNIVANGVGGGFSCGFAAGVHGPSTFGTPPTIADATAYLVGAFIDIDAGCEIDYDAGDANQGHDDDSNSYATPANLGTVTHSTRKYSIYFNYTSAPAGWGGEYCGISVEEFDGVTPEEIDGV
jgi:hypothetical protein